MNRYWGLSLISLLLSTAATAQAPTAPRFDVVGRYPLDGQALTDQLVLYFNEPLAAWNSQDPPLLIAPPLNGTIDFGETYIAFRPDPSALRRKARYTLTPSPELRSLNGTAIVSTGRSFIFPTYEVRLEQIRVREQTEDGVLLEVLLSDEVPIDRLRTGGVSVVDAAGIPVPVWIEVLPLRHAYGLRIPANTNLPVTVTVDKGIPDTRGVFETGRSYTVSFPHPEPLSVKSAVWKRMPDAREIVTVVFSAPVGSDQLKEAAQWTSGADGDPVSFKVRPKGEYRELTLESTEDLSNVEESTIRIVGGLYSADLRAMPEPYQTGLRRTLDQLRITQHRWEDRGVDGPALNIRFNGTLATDALKGKLRVEPDIGEITIEPGHYRDLWIHGNWKSEMNYTATFDAGIEDQAGTLRLSSPLTYVFGETPESKGVAFKHADQYYFPQRHRGKLVLRSLNEDHATLTIHRLFPSNIAEAVELLYGENTSPEFDRRFSEQLDELEVELADTSNEVVETAVDLEEILGPDPRGVFTVQLEPHRGWENTKVLVWTDIGAMAHWQDDELALYVHNLFTLAPIAGAKVTVHSAKNQVMATGTTNNAGIIRLQELSTGLGQPRVAVIETDADYAFIKLENESAGDLPHAGLERYDRDKYDVYMYGDRNLYRPGEAVHLQWIVRTNYGDAVENVPLQFRLWNPNDQEIRTEAVMLSEFGTAGVDIETKPTDPTGRYLAEVRVPGEKVALQSYVFNLEEFVPNRIETRVELDSEVWTAGTDQTFRVIGENLFGGPARNRKSEATLIFRRGSVASEKWPGYHFGNDTPFDPVIRSLGESRTGDDGAAGFTFDGQAPAKATFPIDVTVRGEIQELGGRAVVNSTGATLFPSDTALGVATSSAPAGDTVVVDVAAMRPDETPADLAQVSVALERRTWHYFVRRYRGYNEPSWSESYETIAERTVPLAEGRGRTEFAVPGYGYYRVRVFSEATPQFSTRNFYKFWDRIQTMDAGAKDLVTLTSDADAYEAGETALVRVESPFGGKAVVCVQGESIYDYFTADLVDSKADLRIPIHGDYRPNVWVEVTVIHEVDDAAGETHPFASFAMLNLPIEAPERHLDIALPNIPEEVRPAQTVSLEVQTSDHLGNPAPAIVTVAAVDEGIHAILDYQTPDPAAWFDRSRAPALSRAEYYDQVAYDFEPPAVGGDVMQKRLGKEPSVGENWIKPVALWSGTLTTDASGRATVEFDVPEFNGQLRIVAIAANASATGAASQNVFVRRPYMLRTSMPRFVLPGDEFESSAVVFNTTQTPVTAQLEWTADGALGGVTGKKSLSVDGSGEAQAFAKFTAAPITGQGQIDWRVSVLDESGAIVDTLEETAPIPVRHPAVFQSTRAFVVLEPGESRSFTNIDFLDNELLEARITATANPTLRLQHALKELIGYPYGCLEQTVSRCMPLYLLNKSAVVMDSTLNRNAEVAEYVQAGIDRIFSMQTPSGGIGFWPGSNDPYPYGSVYAAHFVSLVRRDASFNVPDAQWQALREYVERIALAEDDGSASGRYRRAYALYVLAIDGDSAAMDQVSRFDAVKMPASARHLLAAALAINIGDPQRARDYLADAPTMAYEGRETSGTLHSEIRSTAVELLALIEMDAPQEQLVPRTEILIRFLDNARYPNTQDLAFAATAIGRYIETIEANFSGAKCTIVGPQGQTTIIGTEPYHDALEAAAPDYRVVNEGNAPIFVDWVTAGIPAQLQLKPTAEGISIDRTVRAGHTGQRMNSAFSHGDSFLVTLHMETKQHLEHIIVADLLPAGFEIENPRLDSDTLVSMNVKDANMRPAHLEVRDDRLIAAFDELAPGKYRFHYVVRAVTPGTFTWPAVEAECMYDPAVHGRNVPTTIRVESAQ